MRKIFCVLLLVGSAQCLAHAPLSDPMGVKLLDWPRSQISHAYAFGVGLDFGFGLYSDSSDAGTRQMKNRSAVMGSYLAFDIDDRFAFNIDETVTLEVVVDSKVTRSLWYGYDMNGGVSNARKVTIEYRPQQRWQTLKLELDRARFANRGFRGTDLVLASDARGWNTGVLAISDIRLERSHATRALPDSGTLKLNVTDRGGNHLSVRTGLYDASGRQPLGFNSDVQLDWHDSRMKHVGMRDLGHISWPHPNRYVTHSDGDSDYRIPAGEYRLVLMKGPEFRLVERNITITAGETLELDIEMQHWRNMAADNWYSGDVHNHHSREHAQEDQRLMTIAQAEDIKVHNILSMGNANSVAFPQRRMGQAGQYRDQLYHLVSGQEDPRTQYLGHTISLNIDQPVRFADEYFDFQRVYTEVHDQSGLFGYAHLGDFLFNDKAGMALDMIESTVDFVEVHQAAMVRTETWYHYLNLGFKLSPAAGSDWPYLALPGDVRSYVYSDGEFSSQIWFDGLRDGNTFVTNGPMLDLVVNGQPMGSVVETRKGERVLIQASAAINPTLDSLTSLQLVVGGEVIKTVEAVEGQFQLQLDHELVADSGTWIAVRAEGAKRPPQFPPDVEGLLAELVETGHYIFGSAAHSAPVYIHVDRSGSMVKGRAQAAVTSITAQLQALLEPAPVPVRDLEIWETRQRTNTLLSESKHFLHERARAAIKKYENLLQATYTHDKKAH